MNEIKQIKYIGLSPPDKNGLRQPILKKNNKGMQKIRAFKKSALKYMEVGDIDYVKKLIEHYKNTTNYNYQNGQFAFNITEVKREFKLIKKRMDEIKEEKSS